MIQQGYETDSAEEEEEEEEEEDDEENEEEEEEKKPKKLPMKREDSPPFYPGPHVRLAIQLLPVCLEEKIRNL
jgi:hypothetical protein